MGTLLTLAGSVVIAVVIASLIDAKLNKFYINLITGEENFNGERKKVFTAHFTKKEGQKGEQKKQKNSKKAVAGSPLNRAGTPVVSHASATIRKQ